MVMRDLSFGEDATFLLVTETMLADVVGVNIGKRALLLSCSGCRTVLKSVVLLALADIDLSVAGLSPSNSSETHDFQHIKLRDGEVMFILTVETPIRVRDVSAGNNTLLFVGQMPLALIKEFAERFMLQFTTNTHGIYGWRSHKESVSGPERPTAHIPLQRQSMCSTEKADVCCP